MLGINVLVAAVLGIAAWAAILAKWRLGLYLLVVFTPFTGFVVAAFSPSPVGNVIRDIAIVIPVYVAFLLLRGRNDRIAIPFGFVVFAGTLALVVTVNALVGVTGGTLIALLGAKIWLFYIPLAAVASAAIRTREDLLRLMRLFAVMAWVPCTVGLLMWIGALNYGHQAAIEYVYGDFARGATQNFSAFRVGDSMIFRIPGTFQFASQYSAFCIFMVFPLLVHLLLEKARNWRLFGYATFVLVVAAALTSGSRGMFLHLPFALLAVGGLRVAFSRGSNALVVFGLILFGAILVSQFDEVALIDHLAILTEANGRNLVVGGIELAIEKGGLFGLGTGSATNAARHLIDPREFFALGLHAAIENYFAKAWMELGMIGFLTVIGFFVYMIVAGLGIARRIADPQLRDTALVVVGLVVFTVYISTRGLVLDQDPIAYYFWLMIGCMMKLPQLAGARAGSPQGIATSAVRTPAPSVARS